MDPMNMLRSKSLLVAGLLLLGGSVAGAGEEQDLVDVLRSDADTVRKAQACQQLRRVGTAACAPALGALLADERLGHAARHALEGLPFPEATLALRDALGRTSGAARLGVIDSLGWRRDAESVSRLVPLLADADPAVAAVAATALGRIGGEPAIRALLGSLHTVNVVARPAVVDALLAVADRAVAAGDASRLEPIYPIYSALMAASEEDHVRMAAWIGVKHTGLGEAWDGSLTSIQLLLRSQVPTAQVAGLWLAAGERGREATELCAGMLRSSPVEMQIGLLAVLQRRGDPLALPKVRALAGSDDAEVRKAVWSALGSVGDATVVPLLAKAAASPDPLEQMAAQQSLVLLHRGDVTAALLAALPEAPPSERRELFRALSGRGDPGAVPGLLKLAQGDNPALQPGAFQALGRLVDGRHLRTLVEWFLAVKEPGQREDVRGVLESMSERLSGSAAPEVASVPGGEASKDSDPEAEAVRTALERLASGAADSRVRDEARELLRMAGVGKK
jgi:HEAT repeat protein